MHGVLEQILPLQKYFLGKGFDCCAASSVSEACAALFDRPTDALLLMSQSNQEIDEFLLFGEILRQAGAHAPVSVTVAPKLSSEFLASQSADHLVVVGSATYRATSERVVRALNERTCTEEEARILGGLQENSQSGGRLDYTRANALGTDLQ